MTVESFINRIQSVQRACTALARRRIPVRSALLDIRLPHPIIYVENRGDWGGLVWNRYAWGNDGRGQFERFSAHVHDCQIKREVRYL